MLPNSVGEPWLYYIYCYFLVFDQDCTQHISSENACLLISCKIKCINLVMLKKHQTLDFFGNFYMKRTKIQLSELYTDSESSLCVCVRVCVGGYVFTCAVVMPRLPCLPESSMSDSSPFSPQASLSPRAAEDDEVQLVRICYLLANYTHLWQSCQIFVSKPNELIFLPPDWRAVP